MTTAHRPVLTSERIELSLPLDGGTSSAELDRSVQLIAQLNPLSLSFIKGSIAVSTRKAYKQDLTDFRRWRGSISTTPVELSAYLAERAATLSTHTLGRRLVGIGKAHVAQGLTDPTKSAVVRTTLRGIRRLNGHPQRQVFPLLKHNLVLLLSIMNGTKGLRDRALLLLGFAAAMRRSEIVAGGATMGFSERGLL